MNADEFDLVRYHHEQQKANIWQISQLEIAINLL